MPQLIQRLMQLFTGNSSMVVVPTIVALALGLLALRYFSNRRQLLHQERMASLIKGLHYAGVAKDVFAAQKPQSRDLVFSALRWLFGGAGLAGALYGWIAMQPGADQTTAVRAAMVGIVPGSIGVSHLIGAWIHRQKKPAIPRRMFYRVG